ncbi:polysaccharide pyruvyl transferase family protein [Winogradskyella sp. PG-2]|uniref:polysaccharide pyruvyl transferase family protein n=1 Tax=Winogradskyella sp. PG-2 TaxID=754409 RepID=UPI0004585D62|nr:polysaccharide pyruvyl transferase family protein [Winogradskyella sp. PG-2]BAO76187.1 hypothetical protein WPG_1957 [Winogradskyella sp. PG-2]
MKIAILGWYYQNNAGDDRILECLKRKVLSHGITEVEVFVAWDDLSNKLSVINSCDFLLVGGGGLILRNTNRIAEQLKKITIPWAFIGVSIDSVGDDNIKFITYIAKNAKFILVRDKFSFTTFKTYRSKDLFLSPDLTFLYPYKPNNTTESYKATALSLRPWKPNLFKQYTKNYHRFNKLAHKFPFIIDVLGLWNIKRFSKRVKTYVKNSINFLPLHIHTVNGDDALIKHHFNIHKDVSFDINKLKESNYLIGMRLHSLIFATQLGVPFIAVSYASKINHYLEDIGLAEYIVDVNNYKSLFKKIKLLEQRRDDLSKHLLQISNSYTVEVNSIVDTIFKDYILC